MELVRRNTLRYSAKCSIVATRKIVETVRRMVQIWDPEELLQLKPDADLTDRLSSIMGMETYATVFVFSSNSKKFFTVVRSDWFM